MEELRKFNGVGELYKGPLIEKCDHSSKKLETELITTQCQMIQEYNK